MSIYKPKKSPYYAYDFELQGHRFHGSTGATERRAAEIVEKAERRKAASLLAKASGPGGLMTIDEAAGRYWEEIGQHEANADELEKNLARIVDWIEPVTPIVEIDDELVTRLVARRRGEYRWGDAKFGLVSSSQVNRSFTDVLRRVMIRARRKWKVALPDEPDWSTNRLEEPRPRSRGLTYEAEDAIAAVEREGYAEARQFAQISGLRRREVVTLTWQQVDWTAGEIRVVGKGDEPHVLPITSAIRAVLWPLQGKHKVHVFTYVAQRSRIDPKSKRRFIKGARYPITYWGWGTRWARDREKAGLDGVRLHDLRHTSATRLLRATGNLKAAQQLLGHSTIRTTSTFYAHALIDDVAEAMEASATDQVRRRKSRKKSRTATPGQAKTETSSKR